MTTIQTDGGFSTQQIDLIRRQIAPDASADELALFLEVCRGTGLNPFMRQIHAVFRNAKEGDRWVKKMTIQTGIDGYRLLAARTGQLAGIDDAIYDDESGKHPGKATVTVYRLVSGTRVPFTATARWAEYVQTNKDGSPTSMWTRMPFLMLGKCLPYRAKIQTDKGVFMIGDIVNQRLPVSVRSLNPETNEIEWRPVINYFRNGGANEWVKIWVANGTHGNRCIRLTPDHPVLTAYGWADAGKIEVGHPVAVSSPTLSEQQEQIILGSLLGDGTLGGRKVGANLPHFAEAHSTSQQDYLSWKFNALRNLNPTLKVSTAKVKGVEHGVVKLATKSAPVLHEYRQMFYGASGEKRLAPNVLSRLDDLGLAVWIMDDGSLRRDGSTDASRPYLRIYTCCFTEAEHEAMCQFFQERYGVTPQVKRIERNPFLKFSVEDTVKLLTFLSKYITWDSSENTKKWQAPEIEIGAIRGVAYVPVLKVEQYHGSEPEGRYDIEVAGTHNFLYNGVVVHNCAEALALRKAFPAELSGVYTAEEMMQADNSVSALPEPPRGSQHIRPAENVSAVVDDEIDTPASPQTQTTQETAVTDSMQLTHASAEDQRRLVEALRKHGYTTQTAVEALLESVCKRHVNAEALRASKSDISLKELSMVYQRLTHAAQVAEQKQQANGKAAR